METKSTDSLQAAALTIDQFNSDEDKENLYLLGKLWEFWNYYRNWKDYTSFTKPKILVKYWKPVLHAKELFSVFIVTWNCKKCMVIIKTCYVHGEQIGFSQDYVCSFLCFDFWDCAIFFVLNIGTPQIVNFLKYILIYQIAC